MNVQQLTMPKADAKRKLRYVREQLHRRADAEYRVYTHRRSRAVAAVWADWHLDVLRGAATTKPAPMPLGEFRPRRTASFDITELLLALGDVPERVA